MSRYMLRKHNKIKKVYKYKNKPDYLQANEPPPRMELEGRLDLAGIVNFICGFVFILMTVVVCTLMYNQKDKWWGLEIVGAIVFLGGLGTLFLRVGIRQYSKGVPVGKRLEHIIRITKTTLKFTAIVAVIIGIIVGICTLIYPLGYQTKDIYITNKDGGKYDFHLRLEANDIWYITISERTENNKLLELECSRDMKKDLFTDVDYQIKYKINKFSTERRGAVTIEHGKGISITQFGISE